MVLRRIPNILIEEPNSKIATLEIIPGKIIAADVCQITHLNLIVTELGIPYSEIVKKDKKDKYYQYLHYSISERFLDGNVEAIRKFQIDCFRLCSTHREQYLLHEDKFLKQKKMVESFQKELYKLYRDMHFETYLPYSVGFMGTIKNKLKTVK